MKTHNSLYALALTDLISFSGCAASDSGALSDFAQDSQIESEVSTTEQTTAERTTAIQTTTAQTSTEQTASTEPAASEESEQSVLESEPRTISTENFTFVDFDYVSDIKSITDPAQCAWAAEPALALIQNSEECRQLTELLEANPDYLNKAVLDAHYNTGETLADLLTDGKPRAELYSAYIADYDGDGKDEAFVAVSFLRFKSEPFYADPCIYMVYVNSEGIAELADEYSYYEITSVDLLDYGTEKQLVVNAYGTCGADTHSSLLGARDGHSVVFYNGRVSYSKSEFLLTLWGWQAAGGMLAYDIAQHKYVSVVGEPFDLDEFYALDKNGVIAENEMMGDVNPKEVRLLGGQYFLYGRYDYFGVLKFTYENGALVPYEDTDIRNSMFESEFEEVYLEDFDRAVEAMVTPEEAKLT